MTIAAMLKQVREGAIQWSADYKGSAEIANDPLHLFALLAQKPGAVRVCVLFKGEQKRGEFEETGYRDRKFWLVISRGRGFEREPEKQLYEPNAATGPAMFDLVDELCEVVRGFSFDSDTTEVTPDLKDVELFPMPADGPVVDAYYLEFWIGVERESPLPRDLAANRDTVLAGSDDRIV